MGTCELGNFVPPQSTPFMTDSRNSRVEGAIQTLVWAIEEIAKTGNKIAEHHARLALEYLQGKVPDE